MKKQRTNVASSKLVMLLKEFITQCIIKYLHFLGTETSTS